MVAGLHAAAGIVHGGAFHGHQGGVHFRLEQGRLVVVGDHRADPLVGQAEVDAAPAQDGVEAFGRKHGFVHGGDVIADPVLHQRQRLAAHFAQAGEVVDLGAGRQLQSGQGGGVGLHVGEAQYLGGGFFAVVGEIVKQAGELQRAPDLAGDHLRSHATLADQQAGADQFVHGFAHGGPGQVELRREVDFVVQPAARLQDSAVDGRLDPLNHLVVQGYGGGTVDVETKLIRH